MSRPTDDPRPQPGLAEITEELFREKIEREKYEREQAAVISSILDNWDDEGDEPSAPQHRVPTFH